MIYEDKVFEIRKYSDFPHRKDTDEVVRVVDTLAEAEAESMYRNKAERGTQRYYAMDVPHEERFVSKAQRELLGSKYGLR